MSRRKQTKPRQIKRSLGDLEEGDDHPPDDLSLSEDEGGASEQEDSTECDSSPSRDLQQCGGVSAGPGTPDTPGAAATPRREEEEESPPHSGQGKEEEAEPHWDGPDELRLTCVGGFGRILAQKELAPGTTWGPYSGRSHSSRQRDGHEEEAPGLTLIADTELWLKKLPVTSSHSEANCTIYNQGKELYCKVTKAIPVGDSLLAQLPEPLPTVTHNAPVKEEEPEPGPEHPHPEIHLLPQQAGMAAILATAVINKDVFPCKACGIWYRSERNLQAHLQYYCASRKQDPASPPLADPSNEHVCPLAHCSKSCPSASALEIHARTHSGERPFTCLICLTAFTTKANCERHLRVHTDTPSNTCHGCGFVSAARDVLYSHLLTRHMACQPGPRSGGSSPGPGPGPGLPPLLLKTGLGEECGAVLSCQVCGFPADTLALLQQHVQTHLKIQSPAPRQSPSPSSASPEPASVTPSDPAPSPAPPSEGRAPGVRVKEEPRSDSEHEAPPSRSPSPRTPPAGRVKAEPPGDTPGSSPGPLGGGGAGPSPQASEILAKMTEMVHTRLRQGHAPAVPAPARPIHKGATCFECDITFNNVSNFYVHKRLYCSSRRQHGDAPPAPPPATSQAKEGAESSPPAAWLSASPGAPVPRAAPELQAGGASADRKPTEGAGPREAPCSEGESGGRASEASEGSQSPGGSGDDADDPSATFCRACNIRFSRHENYTVHKRFYCAWRHHPGSPRPPAATTCFLPQPVRTRKRKKMYEIHAARSLALAVPGPAPTPSPRPPERDGPIDLRKRPRELGRGPEPPTPPLPVLSDYHKCTACSISFNSIENYLAHKAYYCPVPLQRQALQAGGKLRAPLATPRASPADRTDPAPARTRSPDPSLPTPGSKGASPNSTPPSTLPLACPYCPPGSAVGGDLMDHFRTAHGLVVTRLTSGPSPGNSLPGRRGEAPAVNGSSAPLLNGSPRLSPPTPPLAVTSLTVSPAPEVAKETAPNPLRPTSPPTPVRKSPEATQDQSAPQNGTSHLCQLCNIHFSSLSTFIAHKKYYCSSHSAEHVK